MFSRVIYGARVSLKIGILATVDLAHHRRCCSGAVAGFFGGILDTVIMRITDVFLAIPYVVLAVAIAAVLGKGENTVILVLGLHRLAGDLPHRAIELPRAQAARVRGGRRARSATRARRIMFRHMLPERPPADHRLRHDRGRHA